MTKLSPAQQRAAYGRSFKAPGVINGCGELVFAGIWPTGNVAVKKLSDDARGMGPLTVTSAQAEPLLAAIRHKFNSRGSLRIDAARAAQEGA